MNINKLSNSSISFGYNKRLSKKLESRLASEPNQSVARVFSAINSNCNATEDTIKKLTKDYDKNEIYINILSNYLLSAKTFLCAAVDRLYPELNYTKTEVDTYDDEIMQKGCRKITIGKDADNSPLDTLSVKLEYRWLDDLCENLTAITGEATSFRNTRYADSGFGGYTEGFVDDDDNPIDADISGCIDAFGLSVHKGEEQKASESIKVPGGSNSALIQKFTPLSHSPKSIDEVVGLDKSIKDIKNFIIFPLSNPKEAKRREEEYGIEIPHFIVFNGPPGCGKTMLAEAIAAETNADMYKIDLSSLGSIYANGTVINITNAFKEIENMAANSEKPILVFMDEMDSLLSRRVYDEHSTSEDNKVVNALLQIITSAKDSNIIMIGATNMYDSIDKAVKRRVDMNAYIGLPKEADIKTLLIKQLGKIEKGKNLASDEKAIDELSKELLGYSPAIIINVLKNTLKECFIEDKEIGKEDIIRTLKSGTYEKINEREYMPDNMKETRRIGFNN